MPAARPNVLLIIADDHRADAIGAFGHPVVRTPTLDRLIEQGACFSQARIMGGLMPAVCAPSRACLFTGRNPVRADADPQLAYGPHYEVRLPADACTLPERFRSEGYQTFFTGKWHNDIPALLRSFEAGRRIFHGGMSAHTAVPVRDLPEIAAGAPPRTAVGFSTDLFAEAAQEFLRARDRNRPFFACLAFTSPHDPRTPPEEHRRSYPAEHLPLPGNFLPSHPFDNGSLDIRDERLAPKPLSPAVVRGHLADYYGMISHHDAAIGRVLRTLSETGDAGSTLVVYLSDHGLSVGSHGLLGKQNLYEDSVRVPLVIRGPGVPAGLRNGALAYSFDLFATLCELAGVPPPDGIDSRSLVPSLAPGSPPHRPELGALYMDQQRMVTDGRWKLIAYRVNGAERIQFFDLKGDPDERRDLAESAAYEGLRSRWLARLAAFQRQIGDRWWTAPRAQPR